MTPGRSFSAWLPSKRTIVDLSSKLNSAAGMAKGNGGFVRCQTAPSVFRRHTIFLPHHNGPHCIPALAKASLLFQEKIMIGSLLRSWHVCALLSWGCMRSKWSSACSVSIVNHPSPIKTFPLKDKRMVSIHSNLRFLQNKNDVPPRVNLRYPRPKQSSQSAAHPALR